MKRFALSLLILSFPLLGYAQGRSSSSDQVSDQIYSQKEDTLTILRYKVQESEYALPFMSDSMDIDGKAFDRMTLLDPIPLIGIDAPYLNSARTDAMGFFQFSTETPHVFSLVASLLTTQYEHAQVIIESSLPYRLYLDSDEIGRKNGAPTQSAHQDEYTLKLNPSVHHSLLIRCITTDQSDDAAAHPHLRIRLVPKLGAKSTLTVRDDAQEYMSMEYTMRGKAFTGVSVSPSGKYTIVRQRDYVDLKQINSVQLYEGEQWHAELSGPLSSASWMPSSDRLWSTRNSETGRQLVVYDPATLRETVLATAIPDGYFTILPDEKTLIYTLEQKGPRIHKYVDRVMGRYDHHKDNPDRSRSFLYAYDLTTGAFRRLTYGHRSTAYMGSSLNAREILFSSAHETVTSPFEISDYLTMDLQTGQVDTLFAHTSHISGIYYTSDPRYFLISGDPDAFDGIGRTLPEGVLANTSDTQLFLYDRTKHTAQPLTKDFTPNVTRILVGSDTFKALFQAQDRDYVHLYQIDLASGRITLLPHQEDVVGSFSADRKLQHYAYEGESANNSDRLYFGRLDRGRQTLVVDLAAERLRDVELGEVGDWSYTMPDGDTVPGRFYLPPHFDAQKKYPMLVYYYAGTTPSSRMFDWYYSQPMYAGQGYVVLVLNPSGTTGWGQEYSARHVNAWGKRTAEEIVAAVKGFCAEHEYVNAQKVGCFGASYGGFMTQYLQTITDIFAAAMSHAGISALSSYWGQGTWGIGYSTLASTNSYPWNNPQLYTEQSPLFRADKINTPLLLLHGTADTNVPFGESVQMYNALKILGKEVELIRVYDQDHHILDLPKRIEWMHTTMAWFQKWLKDDPTWWDDMYPEVHLW